MKRAPNSVDSLAPNDLSSLALQKIPVTPGIPHHVICGDRGKGGHKDKTRPVMSDGVVPYWSSHMERRRANSSSRRPRCAQTPAGHRGSGAHSHARALTLFMGRWVAARSEAPLREVIRVFRCRNREHCRPRPNAALPFSEITHAHLVVIARCSSSAHVGKSSSLSCLWRGRVRRVPRRDLVSELGKPQQATCLIAEPNHADRTMIAVRCGNRECI
jgi:hypothetical protein